MNNYIIGRTLGEGGFATVYAGVRKRDGLLVAMKFIHKKTIERYVWSRKYWRFVPFEIFLLDKASNIPGVIRTIDWYETDSHFVIVMERRENLMTLEEYLKRRQPLAEYEAHSVIRQLSFTVTNMMNAGIFHRDLNHRNILIDTDTNEIKIIDFGCGDLFYNRPYTVFSGTETFMPPEWFAQGTYGAKESTVWSIGVILLILLTGLEPFQSHHDVSNCNLNQIVPDFVSPSCKDFIFHTMAIDPRRRCKLEDIVNHSFLLC